MRNETRTGLVVVSVVLAGGLLVLLAGNVLGQGAMWTGTAMPGGMGAGMMSGGMMGGAAHMDSEEMAARHAECQAAMADGA